ncbi:fumarylacetoacetate hydrolase family protein [Limnobacter sp.]|uniref:2-keto-4-pentenoate hydratase n=1 Tax=Limnobacter sp. TaxID=2003368 RepID=UPI0025C35EAD|nr:fumarylacetoacetate hydrolase family protein [Limnobacter sp.]
MDSIIHSAALALRRARESGTPIERISETHGISGLEAAYAVAAVNTQFRIEQGARVVGKKVGLTSKSVQQQLGVDQPDFGVLFDDMEFLDGHSIQTSQFLQPKAEAEVAFVIGKDLKAGSCSYSEFLSSVAYALPAIEVVDSAIDGWKLTLEDTVADNASCGVYVLGSQPVALGSIDLGQIGMHMQINGTVVSVGSGVACLGHPLRAAYWLAQTMAQRGEVIHAGELILSGALGPMVSVKAGDSVVADLGCLGRVSCSFQ